MNQIMVKMENVPTEVLQDISGKWFDSVLRYLDEETVFDVAVINVLMSLGHEAIVNELVRRQRESEEQSGAPVMVPCEPFSDVEVDAAVASLFGGVLDVSMEGSSSDEELEASKVEEEPVEWFDLANLEDHVMRKDVDYFAQDEVPYIQCFASAGETVGSMKRCGWTRFRCRIEDAPQQAAEPNELVLDYPDNMPF